MWQAHVRLSPPGGCLTTPCFVFRGYEMSRVSIFIDGSNFYHALRNAGCNTNIDFHKLGTELCGPDRDLVRIYYYNAPVDQTEYPEAYAAQQRFFSSLHRTPYLELKLGRLMRRGNTFVEKGVDIMIATDMITYAYTDSYDVAILVSGDGDFVPAVLAVKNAGKHVENACFSNSQSHHLLQTCDKFIEIDNGFIANCIPRQ